MSEKGDKGMTEGECLLIVNKDSPFIETVGIIDEFQSRLGLVRICLKEKKENEKIYKIEKDLYEIMGVLYTGQNWQKGDKRIKELKNESENYKKKIKEKSIDLKFFLIPGENEIEARLNNCRTGCRTVERRIKTLQLNRKEKKGLEIDKNILRYFNTLSDFLNWIWRFKFQ